MECETVLTTSRIYRDLAFDLVDHNILLDRAYFNGFPLGDSGAPRILLWRGGGGWQTYWRVWGYGIPPCEKENLGYLTGKTFHKVKWKLQIPTYLFNKFSNYKSLKIVHIYNNTNIHILERFNRSRLPSQPFGPKSYINFKSVFQTFVSPSFNEKLVSRRRLV